MARIDTCTSCTFVPSEQVSECKEDRPIAIVTLEDTTVHAWRRLNKFAVFVAIM